MEEKDLRFEIEEVFINYQLPLLITSKNNQFLALLIDILWTLACLLHSQRYNAIALLFVYFILLVSITSRFCFCYTLVCIDCQVQIQNFFLVFDAASQTECAGEIAGRIGHS